MHTDVALIVRHARLEDWPAVAVLLAELGRPDVLGTDDEEAGRAVFETYLARSDTDALVAQDNHQVVGFCNVEYRTRLNFTSLQAWIPDLIVSEPARSRGAGAMLLALAEALARGRDCWSITLESANWRTRAHAFYKREGWTDSGKSFSRNLGDRPWPPPDPAAQGRSREP